MSEPKPGTVGDLIEQLRTLDPATPIYAAYHTKIEEGTDTDVRCRLRALTLSREFADVRTMQVTGRKGHPMVHVLWSAPDQRIPADPGFAAGVEAAAKVADMCARGYADPPVGLINGACVEACGIIANAIRGIVPLQTKRG